MIKKCLECQKEYQTKREQAKFCSSKCSAIFITKNPLWREQQSKRAKIQMKEKGNPFKGKKHTKESIEKIKKAQINKITIKGNKHYRWRIDRPICLVCKKELSKFKYTHCSKHSGLVGEKNPMWKGGLSFYPYSKDWTNTLKKSIRERDGYICKICGKPQVSLDKKQFAVHHINYNKTDCNPKNLITLCHNCHSKTNNKRNYWINYFKKYE